MLSLNKIALAGITLFAAASCAYAQSNQITLAEWQEMTKAQSKSDQSMRVNIVREAAISAAMRAGLASRSATINLVLNNNARYLDDTFDFASLMLKDNVVPPIIQKVERVTEQSGDVLRFSAFNFRILKQAQFTTRPPTWRTYLIIPRWDDLGRTHSGLLPRNAEEQQAAQEGLAQGWAAGERQANKMFLIGLDRLNNDFLGMATYHALLQSNMVTLPKIVRKEYPVQGDGNSMTIDQTSYTIETKPAFNPKMNEWAALLDSGANSPFSSALGQPPSPQEQEKASIPTFESIQSEWLVN